MNIDIRDVEAMQALRPLEVAAYLRSHGWTSREAGTGRATVWTLTVAGEEYEALLPLDPSIRDFALRMGDLFTSWPRPSSGPRRRSTRTC